MERLSDLPLYERIKSVIERRIETMEWPPNFQIPSEDDLAGEFGASPLTVRRALRELQADGLLERIQGRGTFVIGPRVPCAIFHLPDITEEVSMSGSIHSCRLVEHKVLERENPGYHLLRLPREETIYFTRLIHFEDGTPIQLEDRYVNAAEAPGYIDQDFTAAMPHSWLLRETIVTTIDNTIRAIRPDEEVQGLLQIDATQPCLLLDRATWRQGVPVTRSRFIYPGDRYRLRSSHEARTNRILNTPGKGADSARRLT